MISDTHGHFEPGLKKHIGAADELWHAGDIGDPALLRHLDGAKSIRAVYGNIDGAEIRKTYPEINRFSIDGLKVLMLHIAAPPGKYPARLKALLEQEKPGLLVCGHSHICKVQYDPQYKLLYMNPGACGKEGFHQVKTALCFEVEQGQVQNLSVIEFGKRHELKN